MAKKPQVICLYCNKKFYREDEEYVQIGRRYAHKHCADDVHLVHNIMQKKCGEVYSKTKIDSQINKFVKEGYELHDIVYTIIWWFDVRNEDASKANGGIGIFPHVYPDYIQEKIKKNKIKESLNGQKISDFIDEPKKSFTISKKYIKKPKRVKLFELP